MLTGYLIAALAAAVTQEPEIRGRLVDGEGRPMGDVAIAQAWSYPEPREGEPGAPKPVQSGLVYATDEDGLFGGPLAGRNLPNVLFAIDIELGLGRTIVVREPGDLGDLVMEPLASLSGSFRFRTAGPQPGTAGAWLRLDEAGFAGLWLFSLLDEPARAFAFQIPAGRYRLHYSTDLTNLNRMPPTELRPRLAAGQRTRCVVRSLATLGSSHCGATHGWRTSANRALRARQDSNLRPPVERALGS